MSLSSSSSVFNHSKIAKDGANGSLAALQTRLHVSTDCGDGEHKSTTSQRDIQPATRPSITFESSIKIPIYWTVDIGNDIGITHKGEMVEKVEPESDRYEVERMVDHDGCKGQRLYLVK
jgi:hypothetical protein